MNAEVKVTVSLMTMRIGGQGGGTTTDPGILVAQSQKQLIQVGRRR